MQPGSSIMPAKVNPVIPEAVLMAAAQCASVTTPQSASQPSSGNFQLNVMLPVIAYNLLQSIEILANSEPSPGAGGRKLQQLMSEIMARETWHKIPILVTALNPLIGYSKAAEIAKAAVQQNRPILEVALCK